MKSKEKCDKRNASMHMKMHMKVADSSHPSKQARKSEDVYSKNHKQWAEGQPNHLASNRGKPPM